MRFHAACLKLALAICFLSLFSFHSASARDFITFKHSYKTGSIVVVNSERKLYYVTGPGKAIRYSVAIGVPKEQWTGVTFVQSKKKDPTWTPPLDKEKPWEKRKTMAGGGKNPLGPRAIYLDWSLYRIHGTISPDSIGRAASNGCIRMYNKDVKDLYDRVHIGAPVYVIHSFDRPWHTAKQVAGLQ